MANQKVTNIYNLLSANGLTKAKDVNEFSNWMAGSNYRQNIYGLLKQAGVEGIGSGYGEFTALTGYGKKQPADATQRAQSIGQSVFGGGGQTDYLARQDNYTRPGSLVEQLNQRDKEAEEAITKPLHETAKKVQNRQFTPQKVQYVDENNKVVDEDEVYPVIPKEIAEDELNRMAYDKLQAANKVDLEGEIAKADANATEAYRNAERQNEGLKPSIWQDALHDMADASHVGPVQTKDAYQVAVENDPEYMNRVATLNLLKEADYIQKAAEQSRKTEGKNWRENTVGWFKDAAWSMKENAKKKSTLDNGESTLATFTPLYDAAEKYDRGEQLTDSERELLRSAAIFSAYNDRFSGDISSGVKSGQVTDEAVQFMVEMGINPASGFGKALQKKLVGKGIVKLVENMAESIAKKQGRKAAMKELGKGTLARVGGDILGAAVMAGTSGLQGVAGDTLQRMQGQSQFGVDANGNIQYSGRGENRELNPMVAAAKAFGARTIENQSEMVGAYFAPALGIGGKVLEKGLRSMKLGGVVNFIKSMGATKGAKLVDNFFEKTKWDGTIGEYAEEVVGGIENALVVGDQTLDTDPETGVFNGQQNLETFLSVALMGGFLSTFQTGVGALSYAKGKQQLNRADYLASEALGDAWFGFKQTIDHSTAENASANLSQILSDPNMSPEQKQAVREYARRKESLRGVLYGEESRKKEKAQEKAATRPANIDVAADGQTVVQKNQNGEVISEEKFDDEEEAKAHADILKMQRAEQDFQDDLATAIEASEQRRQAVENGTPDDFPLSEEMEARVRAMAMNQIIPEGVEEGSPEYEAFVRNMDTPGTAENDILLEMMDSFDPLEDTYETVAVLEDSDRNEIDKAIKTDPVKRTERQQKLVSEIAWRLHMYNFPKGELHPEQSYADGQTQADLDGAGTMEADPEAMRQMKQSMDDAQQALDDAVAQNTDLAAYVNETINSNEPFAPEDVISGMIGRFSDDEIATVADYINAQSKLDGYLEYTNGKIQQYVERETSKRAFKGKLNGAPSGNMVMVTDGENQYFLVNGDVQVGENGEILSAGEANGIVVVDEEGNIMPMGLDSSLRVEMGATLEEYAASLLQQQQENTTAQMGFEGEQPSEQPSPNPSEEGNAAEGEPSGTVAPEGEETAEEEVTEAPEEGTALDRIPKDEEGKPIYEQGSAEDTYDVFTEMAGSEEGAKALAQSELNETNKRLTKLQKEREGQLKGNFKGKTIQEKANEMKETVNAIETEKGRIKFWNSVLTVPHNRRLEAGNNPPAVPPTPPQAPVTDTPPTDEVPEWRYDTPEAARKRGYKVIEGHRIDRQEEKEMPKGMEVEVQYSTKDKVKGRMTVSELDDVQGSHLTNGQRNEKHFLNEAQPKAEFGADRQAAAQTNATEANFRPELMLTFNGTQSAYSGSASQTNRRGEVIQGNGRRNLAEYIYAPGNEAVAKKYKDFLKAHAEELGTTAEEIDKMEKPFAHIVLDVSDEEAIRLGQFTAQDLESGGKKVPEISTVTTKLGDRYSTFANIVLRHEDPDASLSERIDNNADEAVKWLNNAGVINNTEAKTLLEDKTLCRQFVKDLITDQLFKDAHPDLRTMFYELPKNIQSAIISVVGREVAISNDKSILKDIQDSIRAFHELTSSSPEFANAQGANFEKRYAAVTAAVNDWLRQINMDGTVNSEKFSNFALELAKLFKSLKDQKTLAGRLRDYYDLVSGAPRELGMFDAPASAEPLSKEQAIKQIFGIENGRQRTVPLAGNNQGSEERGEGSTDTTEGGESKPQGTGQTNGGRGNTGNGEVSERERFIAEHPLTEEDIDNLSSGTRKSLAKKYLNGTDESELAKGAYLSIYNKKVAAETKPQNTEAKPETPKAETPSKPKNEAPAETKPAEAPSTENNATAAAQAKVQAILARMKKNGKKPQNESGTDAYSVTGLTPEQLDDMLDLIEAGAELGYSILDGVNTKEEWMDQMRGMIGEQLKDATSYTDAEVDELLEDLWNAPHTVEGNEKTVGEWAAEKGINVNENSNETESNGENPPAELPGSTAVGSSTEGGLEQGGNNEGNAESGGESGNGSVSGGNNSGTQVKGQANGGRQRTGGNGQTGGKTRRTRQSEQPGNLFGEDGGNGTNETGGTGRSGESADKPAGNSGVGRGSVKGQPAAETPKKPVTDISKEKVPYTPASVGGKFAIGSVIPSGIADSIANAFKRLKEKFFPKKGSTLDFVREELGYKTNEEMLSDFDSGKTDGLAAEQVDAVALAIGKMKEGKSFIVGDMTGVGKGRTAAALIRWGKQHGKKVLFITEKSSLFSDMHRDLTDIGCDYMPFVTNSDADANITDGDGNKVIPKPTKAAQSALWQSDKDTLPKDKKGRQYDFVMTTYSQASNPKGADAKNKLEWLKEYAKDAVVIMDESHNASGESNRGEYFKELVKEASGVTFLSATFAKRPDNMLIYAIKSSMSEVHMAVGDMLQAIKDYGVAMQELMASALFGSGEMIRRERDMSDVKTTWTDPKEIYKEEEYEQCRKTSDKTMSLFNQILDFQRDFVNPIVKRHEQDNEAMNVAAALTGAPQRHTTNTSYKSQASNIVGLMVYAMKAKKAAEMAIEQIKQGKKPVIAVENTFGSYVDELDDEVKDANFGPIFEKGVKFSLKYTTAMYEMGDDGKYHKNKDTEITFDAEDELDDDGQRALENLRQAIADYLDDPDKIDLTLSPIDLVKQMIADAGYSCGEITGRSYQLERKNDGGYRKVSFKTKKKDAARKFNGGSKDKPIPENEQYQALVLNVAGATGISLHSSNKFGNQQPRTMIILQPARDVNTEVQMRGRIDRTGQEHRGEYFYVTSPIPAEQKLTMMLKQKLASLDAQSVGTKKVSSNKVESQDMDNKYGDAVCHDFLLEHLQDINAYLENGLRYNNKTREWEGRPGLLYDVLKDIQRMPCDMQEMVINELSQRYADQIDYLNQNGINDLETTTMDLEAVTIDAATFVKGKDNESVNEFAHDTTIERVEVNVLKKPMRSSDIKKKMKDLDALDENGLPKEGVLGQTEEKVKAVVTSRLDERQQKYDEQEAKLEEKIRKDHPKKDEQTDDEYELMIQSWPTLQEMKNKHKADIAQYSAELQSQYNDIYRAAMYLKPGRPYLVPLTDDVSYDAAMMYGRFLGFQLKNGDPRQVQAVFAVKDSRAMITIPIVNQKKVIEKILSERGDMEIVTLERDEYGGQKNMEEKAKTWDEWWDKMIPKNTNRQIRYMITGNVLQACGNLGKYKGQIVTFTRKNKETGEITLERGMILAENFDPENFKIRREVEKKDVWDSYDEIKDERSGISCHREGDRMVVKFEKRKGEKLADHPAQKDQTLKDLAMNNEIRPSGKTAILCVIKEDNVERALEHLYKEYGYTKEELFVMPDSTEKPDAIIRTNRPYQEIIDEYAPKYGNNKYTVQNRIRQMLKRYKMDVNNEGLKNDIREAVQLRQAYLRKEYSVKESNRLAWEVLILDQRIEQARDDKDYREEMMRRKEAILEELEYRGFKGTALHLEQGKMSLDDVRKLFDQLNDTTTDEGKFKKALFEKVMAKLEKLPMEIYLNEKIDNDTGGFAGGKIINYNWKYMNADYISDDAKASTILHEMIHTVTAYADRCVEDNLEHLLDQDMVDAINELHSIFDAIKNDDTFTHDGVRAYGLTNVREMLSEAGSNSEFRADLKKTGLWVKVKTFIMKFFGIKKGEDMPGARKVNAYDAIMERLDLLIENFKQEAWEEYYKGTRYGGYGYKKADAQKMEAIEQATEGQRAERADAIFNAAKKLFGTTTDIREAGYILPDGTMLDFSGRHQLDEGQDSSFLKGRRTTDHREISNIAYEKDGWTETGLETSMPDFIKMGAIRIDDNAGTINLAVQPTDAQLSALRRLVARNDGEVQVDFGDGWDSEGYVEYDEGTKPQRVFADINRFFERKEQRIKDAQRRESERRDDDIRFREVDSVFFSNAERAVEGIKQEKATPEQWLKMIEKNGGLKAGEDKWMGLSEWLKGQDKKSLTKQEVLDFIRENQIQVEEVNYSENTSDNVKARIEEIQNEFNDVKKEIASELDEFKGDGDVSKQLDDYGNYLYDKYGAAFSLKYTKEEGEKFSELVQKDVSYKKAVRENKDVARTAYRRLSQKYGEGFSEAFELRETNNNSFIVPVKGRAEKFLGENIINDTRRAYTTRGLEGKKEIALTVPTVESWNEDDSIHFGDAGNGRAVAWVRFGETEGVPNGVDADRYHDYSRKMKEAISRRDEMVEQLKRYKGGMLTETQKRLEEEEAYIQQLRERYKDVADVKPTRVLVIDEIQSKRHQEGREKGYKEDYKRIKEEYEKAKKEANDYFDALCEKYPDENDVLYAATEEERERQKQLDRARDAAQMKAENYADLIPNAPFDKNWHELAMKRILRYAAENGYDKVAWTKGEQQAERYDLSHQIDEITSIRNGGGYQVSAMKNGEAVFENWYDSESKLADDFGKDIARKIFSNQESGNTQSFKGLDLKVGGEGMKGFYDQMLPRFMDKYGKKWGVKTGEVELPNVEEAGRKMWAVDVTPEMKESVMQGQPLFREGSASANSQPAEKMKEHLTKLSKKIGTKVVFHDDASTITNAKVKEALQRGKKVAGWYDPKDNSVHFYMPNIKDRYEAEKTIWHEVVGHKGMRALLGEEGYRTFMRRLWMDKSEDFEEMHQWVVENYMRYGGDLYETMDEWFAYNVVEPSVPKNLWDKVMLVLSDVLRKLGFMTTPNMKDMKYMLWLSRNAIREGDAWTELQRNATLAKLDLESRRRASAYGKDAARARDGFANTPTGDTEREMYRNGLMRKMFAWTEAHQDYMASAKLLMDAILKGRKVLDRFNFYMKENHADSKIKIMEDLYVRDYCKPMEDAINRCVAAIGGKLSEAYEVLEDYMAMKHGLERNREFFVRDWLEEKRKKTPTIDDLDEEAKSEFERTERGIEDAFEDGQIETEEERDKELKKALEDSYSSMLDRIESGWASAKAQPTDNLAEWLKGLDDYIRQHIDDEYEAGKHDYSGLTALQPTPAPPEGMGSEYDYDDDAVVGYVADMESKIGEENVTELWEQKGRMTQFALDIEHGAGLITDRNYDKVSQMFHWYMPLRKWDEDMAEDIWSYMNSKKNTYVGRTLMKAGGRKSRAAMPIGTMFAMGGNAISRAARNEVKKAFAGFVRMYERPMANNDDDHDNDPLVTELEAWVENLGTEENPDWVYSFPDIPENATADEVREAKNAWAQHMLELMQEGRAMRVRQGDTIPYRFESKKRSRPEHIVEVYEEGQPHFFIVNDNPRAAQAINGQLKPETKHKYTAILNRLLSSLATSYSPTFVVRNAFRDAEYALNILLVKEGRSYAGRYTKNYAKLMLNGTQKDSVPLIYTLFKKFREGTLDESNEMERYFKEFAENGGITGYVMENNAERWEKEILAGVKEIGQSKAVRVSKNIGNLIKEGLDRYGEGVENAARFATYMTSRQGAKNKNGRTYSEMPRSIIRSVHDAKEVSVNFNRKGAGYKTESLLNEKGEKTANAVAAAKTAQYMRANTLFYNAGLQGVMNSLTNAKKKPWWFAAKFAVPAMTLGMVMALANYGLALLLDDDDDRKKYGTDPYADLPEYTRRQNVCIYLGHGKFVMIPLSIEHRALYGIGDILAGEGAVDGFTDYKGENLKSVDHPLGLDILRQLTAFSPVDYNSKETGIEGVTGWGVGILMPAYVSPFVNAYNNTRWTGTPIQNESKFDNGTTPEYQLAKDYTNDLMVSGSKWWHELWGGNEVQRAGRAEGNKFSKAVGSIIGDKAVEFIGEISPAKVEYVIEQYSGETVKGGAGVKNLFEMMFGDKKMDLRKVPIAKAFVTTPNDNTLYRRTNTKYYKYVDEFRKVEQENRDYQKKVESEEGKTKDLYEKYFNRFKESKRYRQWRIYHPAKGQGGRNYKKEIDGWTDKIKNESDPIQKSGYTMDRNLVIYELVEQLEGTE